MTVWSVCGAIKRPCGSTDLHTDKRSYRPKKDLSCRLYGSTELSVKSINQSFITYYRSYGLADLYTDLQGCTYGLAGLSCVYGSIRYCRAILQTLRICVAVNTVFSVWAEIQENNTHDVKMLWTYLANRNTWQLRINCENVEYQKHHEKF